ncbi:MAG: MFS transporter [Thermaerobacter sp.]|nr:MFS transporter [Thermaerobacter sp.]
MRRRARGGGQNREPLKLNWGRLSAYLLGVFIGALDTSVLGPIFPLLERAFHTTLAWTAWTVTVYTVAYVASTVLAGGLGDRLGHRRILAYGIAGFGVASLLAALSTSLPMFLVARLIQGAGAGAVYPNAQAEGMTYFPEDRRGLALGIFGAVFGVASIVGPVVGGAIGQYLSWPWVFAVNVPLALLVWRLVRRVREPEPTRAGSVVPDWVGGVLFSGLLAAVLLTLSSVGSARYGLLAVGLVLLVVFVRRQRHTPVPFLNVTPLANWSGLALVAGAALVGLDLSASVFVPTLVQRTLGFSVLSSGLALLPAAFTGAVLAGVGGVMVDRVGPRRVLMLGLLLATVGGVLLAWPPLTLGRFFGAMVALGAGTALTMGAPLNRLGLALYGRHEAGQALGLMAVFRSLGLAIGPVVLTLAMVVHGFSGLFGMMAAASLAGVILFSTVVDPTPTSDRHPPAARP